MQNRFLDMTAICIRASNDGFVSMLEGIDRTTRSVLHCLKCCKNHQKRYLRLNANNNNCSSPDGMKISEINVEYFSKFLRIFG